MQEASFPPQRGAKHAAAAALRATRGAGEFVEEFVAPGAQGADQYVATHCARNQVRGPIMPPSSSTREMSLLVRASSIGHARAGQSDTQGVGGGGVGGGGVLHYRCPPCEGQRDSEHQPTNSQPVSEFVGEWRSYHGKCSSLDGCGVQGQFVGEFVAPEAQREYVGEPYVARSLHPAPEVAGGGGVEEGGGALLAIKGGGGARYCAIHKY